ncbi:MAG: hypothetical protein A3B11_00900 [Candidatus Taylorbacteria bacterium RIFCSPLOWO2_01_FULL_44_26]|uniref:Uncharacterized protein n=2 Tax=Parcubacteria group TaxID=1794811 RepID=A0A1G2N628_9BACT|nr:MAG: hypothetical protein A2647_01255 [Candidatus Nomurabacteria bacterium RIFCSPHIGHO2_01_FULL_40_24b]OHA31503.1 MAG: hypothetical protein A3B11_00900 [Candidatus Taylorbacteria bacterium RIFCSPLOWO2_01_FULL_44_26]
MKNIDWKIILSVAALIYAVSFVFRVYTNHQKDREDLRHTRFEECITVLKNHQQQDSTFNDLFYTGPKSVDDCYGK